MSNSFQCPSCRGIMRLKGEYRESGEIIGGVAGAAGGYLCRGAGAQAGASAGAVVGSIVPGVGTAIGGVVGGLGGILAGALLGSAVGGELGGMVDEDYIKEYECQSCGCVLKMS